MSNIDETSSDFNGDGYIDLAVASHKAYGNHVNNSYIFWGGEDGINEQRYTELPCRGPHGMCSVDIGNIMLIDEPATYELIEKMFQTLQKCFRTRLVNIGFDEAHMVGLGKYLDKHGYVNRYELLLRHLQRDRMDCEAQRGCSLPQQ